MLLDEVAIIEELPDAVPLPRLMDGVEATDICRGAFTCVAKVFPCCAVASCDVHEGTFPWLKLEKELIVCDADFGKEAILDW